MNNDNNPEPGGARRRWPPRANWRAPQPAGRGRGQRAAQRPPNRAPRQAPQQEYDEIGDDEPRHLNAIGNRRNHRQPNQRVDRNQNGNDREPHNRNQNRNDYNQNRNERGANNEHNPNRNERNQQNRKDWPMGFRTLEEIANCDDGEIILKITEKKKSFFNLLESDNDKGDMFVLLMQVLSKISSSCFDELKFKLLQEICNSRFIASLRIFLMDLPDTNQAAKQKNLLYWNDQTKFWCNFLKFCECIVNLSPSTAQKCKSLIERTSKLCLEGLKNYHAFVLPNELNQKLILLRERLTVAEEQQEQAQTRRTVDLHEGLEPPNDFRALSVLPTHADLSEQQPFFRPNIVRGGYRDIDHYLDVQFRLLREDCFGPLRDGINQYQTNPNSKKFDNIRVHHNVKFVEPYISQNKIGETVLMDEKTIRRTKKIKWAYSKRFIYGSLLLFTKDNCRTFITATILDRDVKLLSQGRIPVSIVGRDTDDAVYKDSASYTMIESEVYFEPYFHVLKALQDPNFPENLAMNQYIVYVDPTPNPPRYLNEDILFAVRTKYNPKTKFRVLDPNTWPTREDLEFNESQYQAYQLALTHEFAVIQGPPGTGKTYLGVKIANTLLENVPDQKMLIICYTNHALDQFLEAILPVTNSIVRIGGQSRNDALKKFNLAELRTNPQHISDARRMFFEQKRDLKLAVCELQHAQKQLDSLYNGIISYNDLENIPEVEILGQYYADHRSNIKTDPVRHWLFENMDPIDFNTILAEEMVEENDEESNYLFEDIDENDERPELILDNFDDLDVKIEDVHIQASFSVLGAEQKIKTLVRLYCKVDINNRNKKQELQREIVDLKSRLSLFYAMSANRTREPQQQITYRTNFAAVPTVERWSWYFKWAEFVLNHVKRRLQPLRDSLEAANTAYEEARMMLDLKILKNFKVIGMTTSGAARLRKLLQSLAPSIVIVEEAAEVLEQHIVTSLTKTCKHLVLIGDHQQLRPSAAHMKLARHFNIEVSLFERMITNGMHSRRLGVQHRMRPEFAALISPHIYTDLDNHPSVQSFPKVRGMADSLFFLTHNYKEKDVDDSSSKSNELEADMTLKLANYLMQQGYEPEDVTILAAYSGQMFYMRKQREKYIHLSKVKITVVDNYQGEESKIILLSLVRNNSQNKIGFLGTENRVCVALSRAREGFYILGNIEILRKNSELWEKIATTLQNNGSLGSSLMLKCENHSGQITTIKSPKDFEKVPEGGCLLKCGYNLPCGHSCPLICHGYDRGHVNTKCYQNCERELPSELCESKHPCPLLCWIKCQPCKRLVEKVLPCGHKQTIDCYLDRTDPTIQCHTPVTVILPKCEHEVTKPCFQSIETVKCPVPCGNRVEKCGHECQNKCHVDDDPNHERYVCQKPCARAKNGCTANLIGDRGDHQCLKRCYETCDDCTVETVKKRTSCRHSERVGCNVDVDAKPCRKKCARALECTHHCKKKCFEQCGDCTEKVMKPIPDCNHTVQVMCKDEASRKLCREPCERILTCGHRCKQRCDRPCDRQQCTELVEHNFRAPCGHAVKLPCNVYYTALGDVSGEILLKYCKSPCSQWLACDHECSGTCSGCHQGRLHQPCNGICGRANVCGHECNEPCNKVCPPCKKPCEYKCRHSKCNLLCGAPCTPCKEPCTRGCEHGACRNRCGEPCSRKACDEPCPLTLPCGHRCRGLCGEPCPDICNICRPEQFPTGFIGEDFDDDDKFILLQDCGHFMEVESMDCLMKADKETIEIRRCPFCRKPIINTHRYKDLVNHMFKEDINPVKERVFGNKAKILNRENEVSVKVVNMAFSGDYDDVFAWCSRYQDAVVKMHKIVKTQKSASLLKLEMQFQYLEILDMIAECYRKYVDGNLFELEEELLNLVNLLCSVLVANVEKISGQLQQDIGNEIKRMNSIIQLAKILNHAAYKSSQTVPKVMEAVANSKQAVLTWKVFDQDKAIAALKALQDTIKISGIVTKEERDLIVKALGSKIGSWYKCPNGHIYGIDQCGGAMQVSKCADCGAPIGGTHHTLLSNNSHAREMDGSRFAAWSNEYNDMANWQLEDF